LSQYPPRHIYIMLELAQYAACAGVGAFGSSYLPAVGYGYFEMCQVLYRACCAVERPVVSGELIKSSSE
jgi:hypothetical protein